MAETFAVGLRNGILTSEHRERMGIAVWEFMWLIDKTTEEYEHHSGETRGLVLGGSVIQAERIASDLGLSADAVRDHLTKLHLAGYITRERCTNGMRIEVRNSKKRRERTSPTSVPAPTDERVGELEKRHFANSESWRNGILPNQRVGELEIWRYGEKGKPPVLQVSKSPVTSMTRTEEKTLDIAEDIDPEGEERTRAADIWLQAVEQVTLDTPPGAIDFACHAQGVGVTNDTLTVDLSKLPEARHSRMVAYRKTLQLAVSAAAGRPLMIAYVAYDPNTEPRAGP